MILPNEPSPKSPAPCPGFCRNVHGRVQQSDKKLTKHKTAATTLQSQGQAPVMAGGWGQPGLLWNSMTQVLRMRWVIFLPLWPSA